MPRTRKQTAPARLGRQTPTAAVVLPYTKTFGQDAIDLYNSTGRIAQQWQELLLYDILARNEEDLWVHTKFGYAVPRRNGKNEIAAIRELYGLQQGESILHTAHRTTTSRAAWERLCHLLDKAKIPYKSIQAVGREHIQLEEGEGRIEFRTRSSKGGLGEGFDLLVIDEAQEYTDDQASALKYVVTDSENPQTLFCGHPAHAGVLRHGVPQNAQRRPAGRHAEHRLGRVERGAADRPPRRGGLVSDEPQPRHHLHRAQCGG